MIKMDMNVKTKACFVFPVNRSDENEKVINPSIYNSDYVSGISFRRCINILMVSLLLVCYIPVNAQNFEWAFQVSNRNGMQGNFGSDIVLDTLGNFYVTGFVWDTSDFDPGTGNALLASTGNDDAYIAKYDAQGNYLWSIKMGGTGRDQGKAMAVDKAGNIYVTGQFNSASADFDPGPNNAILNTVGNYDAYIAKYDANGNYLWAKSIGGPNIQSPQSIAVDAFDNVYISGYFLDSADFDPGPGVAVLTAAINRINITTGDTIYSNDAFLAKYDADGNYQWAIKIGGTRTENATSVITDAQGNAYITGNFQDTVDFDPGPGVATLICTGSLGDAFLAKYDSSGKYLWAIGMGSSTSDGLEQGTDLAVNKENNCVYVTGTIGSALVNFDPAGTATLSTAGGMDAFIAKYDLDGNYKWAINMGGTLDDQPRGLTLDGAENVYITGTFGSTEVDFDPGSDTAIIRHRGGRQIFAAKYDSDGNYIWAISTQGVCLGTGYGIAVDPGGSTYITGDFQWEPDFDPGPDTFTLSARIDGWFSPESIFVLKLNCNDTSSSYLPVTECKGQYIFDGKIYTTTGIYIHKFPNVLGCDSTVTLDITFYLLEPVITIDGFVLGVNGIYTTYQWYKDGELIPGATNSTYTVTENGDYTVKVTNEAGCEDTSPVYKVTNAENSINDISGIAQHISIYPNPAQNIVYINSPIPVNASIRSIDGRNLLYAENAKEISVKELSQGIYLLNITDTDDRLIKVEKVVIEQ